MPWQSRKIILYKFLFEVVFCSVCTEKFIEYLMILPNILAYDLQINSNA